MEITNDNCVICIVALLMYSCTLRPILANALFSLVLLIARSILLGSCTPEMIMAAYEGGYFPMPDPETNEILWYNPDPRAVIPLNNFHISRSLMRRARKGEFAITFNRDFNGVIEGCADRASTWINGEIKSAYIELFKLGYAHSIEIWSETLLVGGLYGVAQGAIFNAESMFSRRTDASKIAMWALVKRLKECGFEVFEVQFLTPHLAKMGAKEIPRSQYLRQLGVSIQKKVKFTPPDSPFNIL